MNMHKIRNHKASKIKNRLKNRLSNKLNKYLSRCLRMIPIAILPTLLVGCWDSIEINNRSVILEFAIDKNMEHKYDPSIPIDDQSIYNITYTIPDMAKLSGTESLATNMETSIIVQAPTIAASIDDLETKTRNTISFSHVKGILIGENLLRDKALFKQIIDSISRDMVIARNVPLLAVKGEAAITAEIENEQQPVIGLYIMNYFNNKERPRSYFKPQLLGNFVRDIQETGIATIPIFHIPEQNDQTGGLVGEIDQEAGGVGATNRTNNEIDISGGAVIKDYELVDYITKEEVRGQLLVQGEVRNAPITVMYQDSPITYSIKEEKSKLKFDKTPDGPICYVQIEAKGDIAEYSSETEESIFNTSKIKEIQKVLEDELVRQAHLAIDRSKELNTDFLQVGLEMYRKHPKWWKEYGPIWEDGVYEKMPIIVDVNVAIENTGILQ